MKTQSEKILSVPTNIITGFLGVGKTSAITHLLKQKPANERWAVLVNEFGEIGVDGSLFEGEFSTKSGVFIKEVPGGCMCCTSGVPMQIALNQLLLESRPHRLLIEPTGLGHPFEVLQLLSNSYYKKSLNLGKTLTLIDARNLENKRYTEHETFNQQLEIADIIVGNKTDLYQDKDRAALKNYLASKNYQPEQLFFTEHGQVKLDWLAGENHYKVSPKEHHYHDSSNQKDIANVVIPKSGAIKAVNKGEGYHSIGWRFASHIIFNRKRLLALLNSINAIRVKAVFITNEGVLSYNNTRDGINETNLKKATESRFEIICDDINEEWEPLLKQAINQ